MSIQNESIDFSDISGGKNSAFPAHAIAENQVVNTLNILHEKIGASRAPGYEGISVTALFTKPIRGMWTYTLDTGAEKLIVVSDNNIYNVSVSAGTKTSIYASLAADTECYAVNAGGKLWIVNGTDFVKVESDLSVYRVQIAAPTGTSAAVLAGGSLAVGVYACYVAYVRKNASGQFLYSLPLSLGNVTTSGGNLSIRFTVPASGDAQVTHKAIFMTDAGGVVPYYYGEATNATTTIDITNATNRNSSILMSTVSAANALIPISPDSITTFDDRIFVWDFGMRTVYWSLKTDVNPFDMERYLVQNFRTLSYAINHVFSVGVDLYFNHIGNGVTCALSGDMSSVIKLVQRGLWFVPCKTPEGRGAVVYYKGVVWGLTNDGFRYFDGQAFSDDLSFHIKPDIDKIYATMGVWLPSMIVYRRVNKRTEMRLSYNRSDYSTTSNNDQLVFNLDYYFDPMAQKKTWENWENGFIGYAVVGGLIYGAQSFVSAGQIVREIAASDINCYNRLGAFVSIKFIKQSYLKYRTVIDDLDAVTVWGAVYALATASGSINGNLIVFDSNNSTYSFQIQGVSPNVAVLPSESSGLGLALPFIMAPQFPLASTNPMGFECHGNSVTVEISQAEDDVSFFLYKLQLPRAKRIKHNLT